MKRSNTISDSGEIEVDYLVDNENIYEYTMTDRIPGGMSEMNIHFPMHIIKYGLYRKSLRNEILYPTCSTVYS